jgi:transposase
MTDITRGDRATRRGPRGALDERELTRLVGEGLTVRQLAIELDRSPTTVRYWLKKYGIQLQRPGPRRVHGKDADSRKRIKSTCKRHGLTDFALRGDYYRCLRCASEAVMRRRRKVRQRLVQEFGGKCVICGYDVPIALEFHHLDRDAKTFGLAARGITRSYESLCEEASKCILLCSNCHAQVEAGIIRPPANLTGAKLTPRRAA